MCLIYWVTTLSEDSLEVFPVSEDRRLPLLLYLLTFSLLSSFLAVS